MWDKAPSLFGDVVERAAVHRVKEIGKDLASSMGGVAPIDTSRFVSNINASPIAPDWSHDDNKQIGRTAAISQNLVIINAMPDNKLQDLFFTNTVSYADDLEQGSSSKAPDGVFLPSFLAVATYYQ